MFVQYIKNSERDSHLATNYYEIINSKDEFDSPREAIIFIAVGGLTQYGLYWAVSYLINVHTILEQTYSFGGKIWKFILIFVALLVALPGLGMFPIFWWRLIKNLIFFITKLPELIRHEFDIIRRIWANRGFGKYRAFGGFAFYFKLRQRVLAYFLAFLSIGIVTWYFAFRQHTYEKTYWKINFYYGEPLPSFTFKPNIPYTIKAGPDFYGIIINGKRYITGKSTYFTQDVPYMIPAYLPDTWHITFPQQTTIEFLFYEDHINEIFSMTLEIWENKVDGTTMYPVEFNYQTQNNQNKQSEQTTTNKTKKKKK